MWAFILTALAAAPDQVDPTRVPLEMCAVSAVSFRTSNDGWLFDHCGKIFRSSDGGDGWVRTPALEMAIFGKEGDRNSMDHVTRLTWLSPTVGLAFPYDSPFALRTTDAGVTWVKVPAGIDGYVYALEVVDSHIWFCDSSGHLKSSSDRGLTWKKNKKLFDKSDVNPTNWCSAISFLDVQHGWALGWKSLWQTADGGATWTALKPPSATERLEAVALMSSSVAWVADQSGKRFMTTNGGVTWTAKARAPSVSIRVRADDRPMLSASEIASAEWEPSFTAVDDQLDSRFALSLLVIYRLSVLREAPVLSPSSGQRMQLTHIAGTWPRWGAAGRMVFRQRDDGAWYRVAELKSTVTQLAVLESRSWLAMTSDGLFKDGLPADAAAKMDWERLSADGGTGVQRSLECLQSKQGWASLEWQAQGCFGGETALVRLTLDATTARVSTRRSFEKGKGQEQAMGLRSARSWLGQVAAAALEPETPASCISTTTHEVTLKWQCAGQAEQELHFLSNACASRMVGGGETQSFTGDATSSYARALALGALADELLRVPDAGTK